MNNSIPLESALQGVKLVSAETHYRVCNYCEAMCGVQVDFDASAETPEKVFRVRPDKSDTFSHGSMCPKASALGPLYLDPKRLKYPVKKVISDNGDVEWKTIGWDEAYTTVVDNLKRIREQHGANSIGTYLGNPIVHNLGMTMFVKVLTRAIGSKNVFSATSMDQLPHHFAAHFMFGNEFRIPVPDIERTDHMIIMGANPMASNGSIMTSAGVSKRLQNIQNRGGKFIVIDPRKTETAKVCSEHHFIKPGMDLYFLLAFLHILFRDKHIDLGHLADHMVGFEQIEPLVADYNPDTVAPITGLSAAVIEQLVAEFMAAKTAVLYGRMGLSTQPHGGLCHWLINSINIASGNFDKPGGMMFPSPAIELARGKQHDVFGRRHSRVRGLPEFYGELPVSTMADEVLTEGDDQIKGFVTICGNPVLSTPGGHRLDQGLKDIDFMVSIDNFINETTRHADIILPTPSGLETEHYDLVFNIISVTNNAKYSLPMVEIEEDRPFDWQVLKELAHRIAPKGLSLFDRLSTPRRVINLGLMLGEYGKLSSPRRWFTGLSLKKVIDSKHGVDLGPLRSRVPTGLNTPDKKIHITPAVFLKRLAEVNSEEFPQLVAAQDTTAVENSSRFKLIGRRNVYTNNSWMHQVPNLNKSKQVRCTAMLSPISAKALNIFDGEEVKITSRVGEVLIPVEITDSMMPGVVSIPHGFGHARAGTQVPVADLKPGVSVNDLTDPMHIDPLTGNAAFSGLDLEIVKIASAQETLTHTGKPVTVLYGSQSGNAEMIAADAQKIALENGLLPRVVSMSDVSVDDVAEAERLMVIVSTFGEGDMPDAAETLWRALEAAPVGTLGSTHFSVLGLGDRSYENFCQSGVNWDRQLEALGATRIKELVKSDVDYIDAAELWLNDVASDIGAYGDQTVVEQAGGFAAASEPRFNKANPLDFTLSEKRTLTSPTSSKQVMHYELSFEDAHKQSNVQYETGDAIYIIPKNKPTLVDQWLSYLQVKPTDLLPGFDAPAAEVLRDKLELRMPSHASLTLIGQHDERMLKALQEDADITRLFWGQELLDIAQEFALPADQRLALLASLPPLAPRAYSISSSPAKTPGTVAMTIASVRYGDENSKQGVSSCYLADALSVGDSIPGYFVGNKHFSLPEDEQAPMIMVGPGTGIAPFRGFLLERQLLGHGGDNWLFFGDRNAATDFLYQEELLEWQDSGLLNRLDLAFSRDQENKVYVQDRMLDNGAELFAWLEKGAFFFVCGEAKQMAVSVEQALVALIAEHGQMELSQAKEYVVALERDKRYVKDVY